MHELGLTRSIVSIVADHAGGKPVKRIRVAVGSSACVEQRALRFCFGVITEGTALAGAELEFIKAEGDTFVIKEYELEQAA